MTQDVKLGQFYFDSVNHDLLKVVGFSEEHYPENIGGPAGAPIAVPYVRCACISNHSFFGIQEMKLSRLEPPRFIRIGFWRSLGLKWKHRDSTLTNTKVGGGAPPSPFHKKTY